MDRIRRSPQLPKGRHRAIPPVSQAMGSRSLTQVNMAADSRPFHVEICLVLLRRRQPCGPFLIFFPTLGSISWSVRPIFASPSIHWPGWFAVRFNWPLFLVTFLSSAISVLRANVFDRIRSAGLAEECLRGLELCPHQENQRAGSEISKESNQSTEPTLRYHFRWRVSFKSIPPSCRFSLEFHLRNFP